MKITVRFFASMRETVGVSQRHLEVPDGCRLDDIVHILIAQYPALSGHESSWHFAINQTYAEMDVPLKPGDNVSIFPYIAGG